MEKVAVQLVLERGVHALVACCLAVCAPPPRGVDVVLDFVGGPYWDKHLNCLAQDGRLVLLGLVCAPAI